ncbi:hypothetical protein A225_3786 [Klebsiella michiganensis E718]|nr:hypothetical protein A225_3786 [Klebsiella michiganensis E718]
MSAPISARACRLSVRGRYYTCIDMATALHPRPLLTLDFAGKSLAAE